MFYLCIRCIYFYLQEEISDLHGMENGIIKSGMSPPEFLEKEPEGLVPGIEIRNLKKVFSTEKGMTVE